MWDCMAVSSGRPKLGETKKRGHGAINSTAAAEQHKGPSLTKRKHHHWKLRIIHARDDVGDDNGSDVTGRSFTGEVVYDDMPTL